MSKTVNVKVSKTKLLTALNKALEGKKKEKADNEKNVKDHEQALAEIKKSIASLVKSGKLTPKEVSFPYSYRYNAENEREVTVTFAHKVKLPKLSNDYSESRTNEAIEDISNAIRVLEMSDDEFVRTSSYGNVAKYL